VRKIVKIVAVVGALIACFAFAASAWFAKAMSGSWPWELRTPVEYRLPEGYRGWAKIKWGAHQVEPLTKAGKYLVIVVDPSGRAATSTPPERGWASDRYVYPSGDSLRVTGSCKGGMIWAGSFSYPSVPKNENGKVVYRTDPTVGEESFFVGTEQEYRKEADPTGTIYHPCNGSS
jgi:hypothetical protein